MAKAHVKVGKGRGMGGGITIQYVVSLNSGIAWAGGHDLAFPLPATLRADILTKIISQAADRGVTLLATDIAVSGIPV